MLKIQRPMTLSDIVQHIPQGSVQDTAIKVSGFVGGSTFISGFLVDPSYISAIGQFMGGLAALITICYTIYRGKKGK